MKLTIAACLVLLSVLIFWPTSPQKSNETSKLETRKVDRTETKKRNKRIKTKPVFESDGYDGPEMVNEIIHQITDRTRGVKQRTKDILALRRMKVTKADEQALMKHLLTPHELEVYTIKNDIIEHLVRYGSDKRNVGAGLLKILRDSNQSRVMREYVLQYVPEYYQSRWKSNTDWTGIDEEDRQQFNATMWSMTNLTEGSMAGGALFALFRLSADYQDINKNEVFDKAHEVLIDPSYMNPNRMGAVQILSFSNKEDYYDTARQIVLEKQGPVLLQVTAIHTAAKSRVHHKEFHKYLTELSRGGKDIDPTLKRCAQLTLSKIKK